MHGRNSVELPGNAAVRSVNASSSCVRLLDTPQVSLPATIGRYEILERLGEGGMGAVYLGRDPNIGRHIAIKVLHGHLGEPTLRQRFAQEARAAGSLQHPNIVTIHDFGDVEGSPYLVMEYVRGASLATIIRERRAVSLATKLSWLEALCAGLHYAHEGRIVHRDIKPQNLIVDERGTLKILDFGIARVADSGLTRMMMSAVIGTPGYMSPEQIQGGSIDRRSDIFSAGAVAYALISYREAFTGDTVPTVMHRVLTEHPRALAELCEGLPAAVAEIVERALQKAPVDRFQDAGEMRAALEHVRATLAPGAHEPGLASTPVPGSGRPSTARTPSDIIRRRAEEIHRHIVDATQALQRGDYVTVETACEAVLFLDPHNADAQRLLDEAAAARTARAKTPTPVGATLPLNTVPSPPAAPTVVTPAPVDRSSAVSAPAPVSTASSHATPPAPPTRQAPTTPPPAPPDTPPAMAVPPAPARATSVGPPHSSPPPVPIQPLVSSAPPLPPPPVRTAKSALAPPPASIGMPVPEARKHRSWFGPVAVVGTVALMTVAAAFVFLRSTPAPTTPVTPLEPTTQVVRSAPRPTTIPGEPSPAEDVARQLAQAKTNEAAERWADARTQYRAVLALEPTNAEATAALTRIESRLRPQVTTSVPPTTSVPRTTSAPVRGLSNDDVIAMVRRGLGEADIVAAVSRSRAQLDLTPQGVTILRSAGVPDGVIVGLGGRLPAPPVGAIRVRGPAGGDVVVGTHRGTIAANGEVVLGDIPAGAQQVRVMVGGQPVHVTQVAVAAGSESLVTVPAPPPTPPRADPPRTSPAPSAPPRTFSLPSTIGSRILRIAPNAIEYERRDRRGRLDDESFKLDCNGVLLERGKFGMSLRMQRRGGKETSPTAQGDLLKDILEAYAEACAGRR